MSKSRKQPLAQKTRKKRRFHAGVVSLRKIKKYQKTTDSLIPKAPVKRVIKELCTDENARWGKNAIQMLHEAGEQFLVSIFQKAQDNACFDKRVEIREGELQHANK